MFKKILFIVLVVFSTSTAVFAADSAFNIESYTGASMGNVSRADFDKSASVINYSEDVHFLFGGLPVKLGVGGAYRLVRQYGDVNSAGNMKGGRWDVGPVGSIDVPGVFGKTLNITLEPLLILGTYKLSKETITGTKITYQSPLGGRLFLTMDYGKVSFFSNTGVSLMGDYTIYRKYNEGGAATDLDNKLKVWTVALALHLGVL